MNTLLTIIALVGLGFLLVLGFQLTRILHLKTKRLEREMELPREKETPLPTIIGETKTAVGKSLSIAAKPCTTGEMPGQPTGKPVTFAPVYQVPESETGIVRDDEANEMDINVEVDEGNEVPGIVGCFDEDPEPVADTGVMAKELDSLNRLMKKGVLSDENEEAVLSATVAKLDGTRLFDEIIEKFERTTRGQLLEGFRQKVREKELSLLPPGETEPPPENNGREMSTEELMRLIS
jgi:hypothetical protein